VAIALDELEGCLGKKTKEERGVLVAGRRDSASWLEERGIRPWGEQRRVCGRGEQVRDERAERLIFFADRWADGKRFPNISIHSAWFYVFHVAPFFSPSHFLHVGRYNLTDQLMSC
jgi:hypothetical protein